MRMHGFLVLLVLSLTEVAWTCDKDAKNCPDKKESSINSTIGSTIGSTWDAGTQYKLAPDDEYQLAWGPRETEPEKTDFKTGFYKPDRELVDTTYRKPASSEFPEYKPIEKPEMQPRVNSRY